MISIAINGFGRIGRNFLRAYFQNPQLKKNSKISVINVGPSDPALSVHLFEFDTILGTYKGSVEYKRDSIVIDTISIPIITQTELEKQIWKNYEVQWVVDCSGQYTD